MVIQLSRTVKPKSAVSGQAERDYDTMVSFYVTLFRKDLHS